MTVLINSSKQKNNPPKPFTSVRLVVDPPEGLKALECNNYKFKKSTLFVEVIHGNENGVLNTQWIPLPCDPKLFNQRKPLFDLKTIEDINFPRTTNQPYAPIVLSNPGSIFGSSVTLSIPTSSGECQLALTPEGHVSIKRVPADLDLSIETHGLIKTGADLQCHSVNLTAVNVLNTHSLLAEAIQIKAKQKITNEGVISAKKSVDITASVELVNKPNALLTSDGILKIEQTPVVVNDGTMNGSEHLEIPTPTCLNNGITGKMKSNSCMKVVLSANSKNNGTMSSKKLVLTGETLENSETGTLKADENLDVDLLGLDNAGKMDSARTLCVKTKNGLENKPTGQINSKKGKFTALFAKFTNQGLVKAKHVTLNRRAGNASTVTLDNEGGTIVATEKLQLQQSSINNYKGRLKGSEVDVSCSGDLNNRQGRIIAKETINLNVNEDIQNSHGLINAECSVTVKTDAAVKCQDGGAIFSKDGKVSVTAENINVDESSLVKGGDDTELLADNHVHTSTPIVSKITSVKAKLLDIDGGINSATSATLHQHEGMLHLKKKIKGGKFDITAPSILGDADLAATSRVALTTSDTTIEYPLRNRNKISSTGGDITYSGQGISNKTGTIKTTKNIDVTAVNIDLTSETDAGGDFALHHQGGIWQVSDKVKASGELSFHRVDGFDVTEEREARGSLKYVLPETAKIPLNFLANQVAKNGHLKIETPTTVRVGNDEKFVSLISTEKLETSGQHIDLANGRMAGGSVKLASKSDIILGHKGKHCAVASTTDIELNAESEVIWDHLHLVNGGNLTVNGKLFDDISSHGHVVGDATFNVPLSKHRLLTLYKANGHQVSLNDWDKAFHSYKTIGPSEEALTEPAKFTVEGKLKTTGKTEIFGSQVACSSFEGKTPIVTNFYPYISFIKAYFCGHKEYKKCHWEYVPCLSAGTPLMGILSQGETLESSDVVLNLQGFVTVPSMRFIGIMHGQIGQANTLHFRVPPPAPFRSEISLMDFAIPSTLFDITEADYPTIYKPIIPFNIMGSIVPIMVIESNGNLTPNLENLRCVLTPLQEREFLVNAMMDGIKRNHFSLNLSKPHEILQFLKENTEQYYRDGRPDLLKPMIAYRKIDFMHTSKRIEKGLIPFLYLPKSMDNPRLRDWAGGLSATVDGIAFEGASQDNSVLLVNGNLDAQKSITYQNFNLVSHTRNSFVTTETITHEDKQKRLLRHSKKTQTSENVPVTVFQPGNATVAERVHYIGVNHIYTEVAQNRLGKGGLKIEGGKTVVDQGILQNQIGARTTKKQKGILGMGGTTTISQSVSQRAIGSTIQTEGPVHIQAQYGQFDATRFLDDNGNERSTFNHVSRQFLLGLKYEPVPRDGHCLFNAVALYLGQSQEFLRNKVAMHIEQNMEQYLDVIQPLYPERTPEQYLQDLREGIEWADNLEIAVLMKILDRPIVVVDNDNKIINRSDLIGTGDPIFVQYNGYDHYDGLVLTGESNPREILEALIQLTEHPGNADQVTFVIKELRFHELLRAIEAHDRALAAELREQERTAKRKRRQGTFWVLVSLPLTYYLSGAISGALASAMNVTLAPTVVGGVVVAEATASTTQMAFIAAASGAGAGLASAAIQGQSMGKAALQGGAFAMLGNLVQNAPQLAQNSQAVRDLTAGFAVGGASAAANHGNILQGAVIGAGAAWGASMAFPSSPGSSLSTNERIGKGLTEAGIATIASNGSSDSLVRNLTSAYVGATVGQFAGELGSRHGSQLGSQQTTKTPLANTSHNTNRSLPLNKPSISKTASNATNDGNRVAYSSTELLEIATKEASQVLAQNGMHMSDAKIKNAFRSHLALKGSGQEVNDKLINLGRANGERDTKSAFVKGLQVVFESTVNNMMGLVGIGNAHASTVDSVSDRVMRTYNPQDNKKFFLSSALLDDMRSAQTKQGNQYSGSGKTSALIPSRQSCGFSTWRALFGDESPEVLACQKQNRASMPRLAKSYDALYGVNQELRVGTRVLGGLQVVGGATQITASSVLGFASAPTLVGPAFATFIGVMGADNVMTGLHTMTTGEHQPTGFFRAISALGEKTNAYGPQGASYIEAGLNMTSLVNPKALTFAYRAVGGSKLKPQGTLPETERVHRVLESTKTPSSLMAWNRFSQISTIQGNPNVYRIDQLAASELTLTHELRMGKNAFGKFVENIRENGIVEPIKYVEHNGLKYVVNGHHRLNAARKLGMTFVPAEQVSLPYLGYKVEADLMYYGSWK